MTEFDVYLSDGSRQTVPADGYGLEGPLTTFFLSDCGRVVLDSWSTRLASFRTADVRRIERQAPVAGASAA
ncbi:MAG: hypothetical protein IH940_00180 [Acidobacteria bacterium]|nr:hypothetical protein [Acidobacteriota bacterium]